RLEMKRRATDFYLETQAPWWRTELRLAGKMSALPRCLQRASALLLILAFWAGGAAGGRAADASEAFYDPEVVQKIRLEIKPEDLDRLHRALPRRIFVPATFRWNERVLERVGV